MKKTILIPIDWNVESLNTLKFVLSAGEFTSVDIVLMYAHKLSDSITDMLFYSPSNIIGSYTTPLFEEAISILRNRHETIVNSVSIELFHGYGVNALKKFVEARGIDIIYIPKRYSLKLEKRGFNPIPIIKKSKLAYKEIEWSPELNSSGEDQLNVLFK